MMNQVDHRRVAALLFVFVACSPFTFAGDVAESSASSERLRQQNFAKIDVHTHYNFDRDFLSSILQQWNMKAVTVEVIKMGKAERERWEAMTKVHEAYPETVLLCTSFDASKIDDPKFAEKVINQLTEDLAAGAIMVKIWKNVGMVYRDDSDRYIQIDDPRFQPIWDFLVERKIPLLAHIGEPRAAWRALNHRDPHYTYYKEHPQYHNYQKSEVPSWETIIDARDRFLELNPDLTVIGAHLGSMAYDTDEIAKRLDRFPNFYVDTAERFGDLAIQPSDKVREFFIKYSDRVLYGTDLSLRVSAEDQSDEAKRIEREGIETRLKVHWRYMTDTGLMQFVRTGTTFQTQTTGLGLPRDVIEKVYFGNAAKLLNLSDANEK